MKIHAYAAKSAKQNLSSFEYEASPLGPEDVEIKISHCGICHSDVHLVDDDWGMSQFPLVPGHEVVGTISAKGQGVRHLDLGQRVGLGWQRNACLECEYCIRGDENLCSQQTATCVGNHGGFAESIRVPKYFVFPLPDNLSPENAAPLLCGGITVFSPLIEFGVKPTDRIGVIGIGGLGHLALQFARSFGCEVTAFSTQANKEKEAREFGAHRFVVSKDVNAMAAEANHFDFILNTAHANLEWANWLTLLRPDGTLCFVGVPSEPINVPVFPLLAGRKRIVGSPIGSRTRIADMLEFAARHDIQAKIELSPATEVNAALERVRKNEARYRMVLKF